MFDRSVLCNVLTHETQHILVGGIRSRFDGGLACECTAYAHGVGIKLCAESPTLASKNIA